MHKMTRQKAWELVREWVDSDVLRKHMLATEAIMRALARKFGEDEESWALAGLLHDLDFEETKDEPSKHAAVAAERVSKSGATAEVVQAIKAHNAEVLGLERRTRLDFALTCAESITGLVVAAVLVLPDKRLASLRPDSVVKKMKKRDFARNVSRESIMLCERIGLGLDEFAVVSVEAMQDVAEELGL